MRSPLARGAIAIGAIAIVVVLFVVLAGGDDDGGNGATTTQAQTPTTTETGTTATETTKTVTTPAIEQVTVRGGEPVGGVKELEFDSGERVRFAVRSDVTDEVHVHGYDVSEEVPAGGSVRFSFPASIEGVFEVELEGRGVQIAELRVSP
jgi:hypothetical protein